MKSTNTTRGRPPSDLGWADIAAKAQRTLPADGEFNENEHMVDEWRTENRSWHGCSLHPKNFARAFDSVWVCKFYLAGEQRVIGRGTLYQCARLYDAAQVHYAKYRTGKPTRFNFDEQQAKSDQCHADFVHFFGAISDLLEERGIVLTTAEQRAEHSRLRTLDRQHETRTASGRIEVRLTALEKLAQEQSATLARYETCLNTLNTQLACLISLPTVTPATPEILTDAKNNLTPISDVVSCTHAD